MILPGTILQIHYELKLEGIGIVESTFEESPQQFSFADGTFHPYIESQLVHSAVGQEIEFTIPAEAQVFGIYDSTKIISVSKERFPIEPTVGQVVDLELSVEEQILGKVIRVNAQDVELDCNNLLIGHAVQCRLIVVSIRQIEK